MTYKRLLSVLLAVVMLFTAVTGTLFSVSADTAKAETVQAEPTSDEVATKDEPQTPQQPANRFFEEAQKLDKAYAYSGDDLGCTYTESATTFKVWAPTASELIVNLFATGSDSEEGAANLGTYAMAKDMDGDEWTGCWSATIKGDLKNVYYTYTVTCKSLVFNSQKTSEVVDPYAKAVGVNGKRAMVVDLDSTDPEGWDKDTHILLDSQSDAVVWELVIRDFSASETSGVSEANRGKFLAFTEDGTTLNGEGDVATCVAYLKEMGVTHVQINPMFDFATVNEAGDLDTQYNWGYDPENYNVPEGSYSSNPYDGNMRINECKQMIQALHEAGIGVIMDVVYNHTYYSSTSNFQLLVPNYYYRMQSNGFFSGGTGCGNDTASERAMFRKFMIDSVTYWAQEYHVDGFRFDLMGTHDVETMNLIRDELDKIDTGIIMYGEGWKCNSTFDNTTCTGAETVSATQANADLLSDRIGLFNDEVRDGIKGYVFEETDKGFVQGDTTCYMPIYNSIRANTVGEDCAWTATAPSQTVTYASCHDNHALYDRLVSSMYGKDVDFRQRYSEIIAMNKLSAGILFTSQGMSFMLAGEEMGRTKDGDNNSYKSSVQRNAIDWSLLSTNADLVSYYRGLIDIRKAFSPFTEGTTAYADSYTFYEITEEIENEKPTSSEDEFITTSDYVAFTVDNDTQGEWDKILVIFNSSADTKTVEIDTDVTQWAVIANESYAGLDAIEYVQGNTFEVAPGSCFIAVDKESYDSAGIKSDDGKVIIKHIDGETKEVLASTVITGTVGTGYDVTVEAMDLVEYNLKEIKGETKGVYTKEDKIITCEYEAYRAPSLVNADTDGNGKVNISDVTTIQKYLAEIITLNEERLALADIDYSGKVNIKDATMLQKDLAGFRVSIGTLVVSYYTLDEEGNKVSLAPTETKQWRVGAEYEAKPLKFTLLEVSEELSTNNAKGVLPTGVTTVEFCYVEATSGVRVYAAHLNPEETWVPYLWAWSNGVGNAFTSWPGGAMEDNGDGWFAVDADLPRNDYSIIISNKGTPQTADYNGLSGGEIWIVIDDYNVVNGGKFITVYTEKPDLEALRAQVAIQ